MTELAIRARGLVKRFGENVALDGVDLDVPHGAIYGLLGPNGAGKTTAVRVFTTLLRPDEGSAAIDGIDVVADPNGVRERIGLTGQYAAVEERLTGRENMEYVGRLFHLPRPEVRSRAAALLERFDLTDAANRVVKGYSGGMRRRLDIAMSLIARPSVLFLDEPTTGLDPRSRLAMWDLIEELEHDGTRWYQVQSFAYPEIYERAANGPRQQAPEQVDVRGFATRVAEPGPGDDVGTLVVWSDGVAYFVSESGDLFAWLVDEVLTYEWVC